jgi:hypothetical protein
MERQLMKDLGREPAPGPEQGPSQTYVVHTLPGYYGGSVQTNESYSFFHRGFQESARREREKDDGVTLLNCTEGGAFIEGFEHVALSKALQDTLASRPNLDVPQLLDDVYGDGRIDERQQKLQKALTKIWMGLNRCEDAARRCKRGAKDARTNPNKIRSLSRTEAEMITQINQVDFISLVAQAEIDAAVVEGGRARNATESLKASERLYDVVLKATSELKPVVSKAMSELEALMKKQ